MTLISPQAPTLRATDSLKVQYNGTYGITVAIPDPARPGGIRIGVDLAEGPLPHGKFVWNGEDYLGGLEAGQAKLVPFDLVRVFFGDPRSVASQDGKPVFGRTEDRNGIGDIAPRENEIRRLCTLYGVYDVNMDMLPDAIPDVTITTGDDVEIICPVRDPEGKHIYGYEKDETEIHDVATQLAHMKEQIKLLEQAQAAEAKKGARNDGADVKTDGPPGR
jgi:hypothetical protein